MKMWWRERPESGFTLLELLLVTTLIGAILAVVVPRAMRASTEAKFNQVRQYSSEISSYTIQWAQNKAASTGADDSYSIRDILTQNISRDNSGFENTAILDHYTGDEAFDGVEAMFPHTSLPKNPFNEVNYFSPVNNDVAATVQGNGNSARGVAIVPSRKPGLIYLVSGDDPLVPGATYFYFIYTGVAGSSDGGQTGSWYGGIDHHNPDAIRRGTFVAHLPSSPMSSAGRGNQPRMRRRVVTPQ